MSFSTEFPKPAATPHPPHGLVAIHVVAAVYGIGFGSILSLTGSFSGLHVLFAGITHVAVGIGFFAAAMGISKASRSAYIGGCLLSVAVATIAIVVTVSCVQRGESTPATVWGFINAYFSAIAFVTWHSFRAITSSKTPDNDH